MAESEEEVKSPLMWVKGESEQASLKLNTQKTKIMASSPITSWRIVKVAQSCPSLHDPMDYTVHGILQTRILEWVAIPFSRGSSQPRDQIQVSHAAGWLFTSWATREAKQEEKWKQLQILFLGALDTDCSHEIKRCLLPGRKAMTNLDSILKSRDITLLTKVCKVKAMVFPVVMCGCESWPIKKHWVPNNWCFQNVVLEKTLESHLDFKKIKPVNPKGNQP